MKLLFILHLSNMTLVGRLTSQHHATVSLGQICSDNCACCQTETEVLYQTFYLTQSQSTDTRPTIPSTDPVKLGTWQGSHWSANFQVTSMTRPRKILAQVEIEPPPATLEVDAVTARPVRQYLSSNLKYTTASCIIYT